MFSKLAVNRSPQHQPISFNKKKVILPASMFNKDKDKSISRQPKENRSLTPQHKMQLTIQSSRSKPLLVINKQKDRKEECHSKSTFKTSFCQNCNSFMLNDSQKSFMNNDWKQQIKSLKDTTRKNQLQNILQSISAKSAKLEQKKQIIEVHKLRLNETFTQQKQKVNEFYSKIISVITKHREGVLSSLQHKQHKIEMEIKSLINSMQLNIQQLSLVQQESICIIPNLEKLSEQNFKRTMNSIKNQYQNINTETKTPKLKLNSVNIVISDGKYISQQLVSLIEHCLVISDSNKLIDNKAFNQVSNQDQLSNNFLLKQKQKGNDNELNKYISIQDNEVQEEDMLLSKRN